MAAYAGPNIVEDGLILSLDAANAKSYPGSGTTWSDLSKSGKNGTLTNGATYISNNSGYISVDGVDDYIVISDTNYPSSISDSFSIECILNIPSDAVWSDGSYYGNIFTRGTYGGSHGIMRLVSNNDIAFWVRGDSGLGYAHATIEREKWYHCVGTWDGLNAKIYINGSLIRSSSLILTGNFETNAWYIGLIQGLAGAAGNKFKGDIATAKVYNKELAAAEIQQNFNALRGRYGI